jgi:hypothetical protein
LSNITLDSIAAEFDDLLSSIQGLASYTDSKEQTEQSHTLLGSLFRVVSKLNYLLRQQMTREESALSMTQPASNQQSISTLDSSLLDSLDQWIQKIKQAFSQLAKFLGAASYTIGFQVPLGIQVSITFTP